MILMGAHTLGMVISLQTVGSLFRDDPRFYNPATYFLAGLPILLWIVVTLRSRFTTERACLALAAISALSMLPVYHRQYDAKLLLLTVPACAMLWAEGGMLGRLALLVNTVGFVLTGDLSWMAILGLISKLFPPTTGLSEHILAGAQVFSAPLVLLIMGVFYLWVYVRRCSEHAPT
jgi:hypothetical protein